MDDRAFDFYADHYKARWSNVPQWKDVRKIMEWAADKPGRETGFVELARVCDENAAPRDEAVLSRVLAVLVILTTGPHPFANAFYEVKSGDGRLYPVSGVAKDVRDGLRPYLLEDTGEIIADFSRNAYPRFRFALFEPRYEAAAGPLSPTHP